MASNNNDNNHDNNHNLNDHGSDDDDDSSSSVRRSAKRQCIRRHIVGETHCYPTGCDDSKTGVGHSEITTRMEVLRFQIHKFAEFTVADGAYFWTDYLYCHGYKWRIKLYPVGETDKDPDDGDYVACYLECQNASLTNHVKARFAFRFDAAKPSHEWDDEYLFEDYVGFFDQPDEGVGNGNLVEYEDVLANCVDDDGTLTVDVELEVYHNRKFNEGGTIWYPPKLDPLTEKIPPPGKHMLESEVGKDVTFVVGGSGENSTEQNFKAHKCILFHRAPVLYEFIQDLEEFKLPNVCCYAFQHILEYIYASTLPQLDIVNQPSDRSTIDVAKDTIIAADKYALTTLKLHIESEITRKMVSPQNCAEWIPFADSYSCPLLKEYCMNLYTEQPKVVKASKGWKKITESSGLLVELLDYCESNKSSTVRIPTSCEDYDNMDVGSLRNECQANRLELDGTRTMLMKRLQDYRREQAKIKAQKAKEDEKKQQESSKTGRLRL